MPSNRGTCRTQSVLRAGLFAGSRRCRSKAICALDPLFRFVSRLWNIAWADWRLDWDISNNASYLNAVGGEFFGKTPEVAARGLPQSDYLDLVHPDDVAGFVQTLDESVRVGGAFTYDYRITLNDRSRWVRSEGNCALDASGRPTRAFGSLIDITAIKQADAWRMGSAPL